jgi:hypothetical protein
MPAVVLQAWFYAQRNEYQYAAPLIELALDAGVLPPGHWHIGSLINDESQRPLALRVIQATTDLGPIYEATGYWQSFWNAGDRDAAVAIFESAAVPQSRERRRELEELVGEARASTTEINNAAAVVDAAREAATRTITEHEDSINAEKTRVESLVREVTSLVQGVTADHMAKAYADRSKQALRTANWWTAAAILVGLAGAGWAAFVAIHAFQEDEGLTTTIGKVLVSIPVLIVAGYLAGIAASHRRMGWHWSHVDLQIRTAEPFIGALDKEARDKLLAALAIRFFPGQGQDPQHGSASSETMDVSSLVQGVFQEFSPRRGPSAPGSTPSAQDPTPTATPTPSD